MDAPLKLTCASDHIFSIIYKVNGTPLDLSYYNVFLEFSTKKHRGFVEDITVDVDYSDEVTGQIFFTIPGATVDSMFDSSVSWYRVRITSGQYGELETVILRGDVTYDED